LNRSILKAAEILDEMAPDEAADALAELEDLPAPIFLKRWKRSRNPCQELLSSRGHRWGMMNTVRFASGRARSRTRSALRGNEEMLESLNMSF
jgi:hypothetical protein